MKQKLAAWLAGDREYSKGVDLLKALKIDPDTHAFFEGEETRSKKNILVSKLERYARVNRVKLIRKKGGSTHVDVRMKGVVKTKTHMLNQDDVQQMTPPIANVDDSLHVLQNPGSLDNLPEELKAERAAIIEEVRKVNAKIIQLQEIPEDAENNEKRKALIEEIIPEREKIRKAWEAFDKNVAGQEPEATPEKDPSKLTLEDIEAIEDPEVKTERKLKRIDANKNYLRRNWTKDSEKVKAELEIRKSELDKWEVSYDDIAQKHSAGTE